jgi:hypothetical protein
MPPSTSQILINSSHFDSDTNSWRYTFPFEQKFSANDSIGVTSMAFYNSWPNVSAALGNNQVIIAFPSGADSYVLVTTTLDDGFYETVYGSLYLALQKIMIDNKMYVVSTTNSSKYFYLNLNVSSTYYGNVLSTYAVPTTAVPPDGAPWSQLTGTARSPKIYFGKGLGKIVGFSEPSETDFTTSYGATTEPLLNTLSNDVAKTTHLTASPLPPQDSYSTTD